MIAIYPKFKYTKVKADGKITHSIQSFLRKKHKDDYYLERHITYAQAVDDKKNVREQLQEEFNRSIYNSMLYGRVNTDIEDMRGHKVFILDTQNMSEFVRLENHIYGGMKFNIGDLVCYHKEAGHGYSDNYTGTVSDIDVIKGKVSYRVVDIKRRGLYVGKKAYHDFTKSKDKWVEEIKLSKATTNG
jgi:hypothetical protein